MKVRPMYKAYKVNATGEANQPMRMASLSSDSSVESDKLFGSSEPDKSDFENTGIYNKRAYIEFQIPVLNFFLAGENPTTLGRILGRSDMKAIAEGKVIYDKFTGKDITASNIGNDIVYSSNILIGGEYIRYLIDQLDVEAEIAKEVNRIMFSALGLPASAAHSDNLAELNNMGSVVRGSGDVFIYDDYYFNLSAEGMNVEVLQKDVTSVVASVLDNFTCRLALLTACRNKSVIADQVQDFMFVLPKGYRDKFQNRSHSLSKAYDRVIRANNELISLCCSGQTSVESVRLCYLDLVDAVKNVTVKGTNDYDKQYSPLADMLKGKPGLIRNKMQGTRTDYSGRSVIVVDPEMSVDTIGVPESMAVKLKELDVIQNYKTKAPNKRDILSPKNMYLKQKMASDLMDGSYVVSGRQPTLYRLGLRGFKAKTVPGKAIVMNPTVTPAFNADFDGDQMHLEVPISPEAKEEVRTLMSVTENLFYPRNGECHITPRQEMIYGLWKATSIGFNERSKEYRYPDTPESYNEIYEKVHDQSMRIYDKVDLGGTVKTAGYYAVKGCLKSKYRKYRFGVTPLTSNPATAERPVTEDFFKELNRLIALDSKADFIYTQNRLVALGFAVAEFFPCDVSVIKYEDVSYLIDEFEENIAEREELYNMGFETKESFEAEYDKVYKELESKVKKAVVAGLGDNGFVEMMVSKARGSESNLMQMFGMKGRVMKNSAEVFEAIIKKPLVEQFTGLEHMVTAYGSRQGLVDKSIATYGPGYLSRLMCHSSSSVSIVSEDCGTTDGILLSYDFLKQFVSADVLTGDDKADNKYVRDLAVKILVGRYVVGSNREIMNEDDAIAVYEANIAAINRDKSELVIKSGVKMRSPLTCKCPICAKCYGRDLGTQAPAVVGLPVGFEAATSIGEPTTQLIMKNFQTGGVAGVKNLTSSFDIMKHYIELPHNSRSSSEPIDYDFIAPVEGYVETISRGNGTKELQIMAPNAKGELKSKLRLTVLLHESVKTKDYVHVGDSIQAQQGELDIHEMVQYRSAEEAEAYLAFKLFDIFKSASVFVSSKHFEVLVSTMIFKICIKGNDYFKPGRFYTLVEYWGHDHEDCVFTTTIKGVKEVPLFRNDVCSTIFMEHLQKGISRSIIMSGEDELKLPIVRYSFGLSPKLGNEIPGYLESRGKL